MNKNSFLPQLRHISYVIKYYCYKLIVHFKMAMAGNGAEVGAGAKISKKVKPEQKINNFGSATQLINFLHL